MSQYVVLPPQRHDPKPSRHRTLWLIIGAVLLGLSALWFAWLILGLIWDMSRIYGNENPWACVMYAPVPAVLVAGCARCLLSLRHRGRPGFLLLSAVAFAVLGATGVVLGYAGSAQNSAYRATQADIYLAGQRDTLRGLPMHQAPGGDVVAEPMCGSDDVCSIDVWVQGDSASVSLDRMTAQMLEAGWVVEERGPVSAMYAGPVNIVEATVAQEGDNGGTSFQVRVIK